MARKARLLTYSGGNVGSILLLVTVPINIQSCKLSYNFPSLKLTARVAAEDMNVGEVVRKEG